MKKLALLAAALFVLLAQQAVAATFGQDDLTGTWKGYWFETTSTNSYKYWIRTTVTVDDQGNISGDYLTSNDGTGTVDSGSIEISSNGSVSFTMHMSDGSDVVSSSAWMDLSKTYAYAATRHGTRMATGMLVKTGQVAYSTADLAGDWRGLILEGQQNLNGESWWVETSTTVSTEGTSSGSWDYMNEDTGTISSSTVTLDAQGGYGGSLTITGGSAAALSEGPQDASQTVNLIDGLMDASRQLGVVVTEKLSGAYGRMIRIRRDRNDLQTSDLEGDWKLYMTEIVDMTTQYWVHGDLSIDAAGSISGDWYGPEGQTGTFSGEVFVNAQGDLSGYIVNDTIGKTLTLDKGSLCESTNCAGALLRWGSTSVFGHTLSHAFLVRKQVSQPVAGGNMGISGLLLLQ